MNTKGYVVAIVVALLVVGWVVYCNTGVRRMAFDVELLIEEQCHTFAECRVNVYGTAVNCWAIDTNDAIEMYAVGEEYPTWGDIDVFCTHLEIVRRNI